MLIPFGEITPDGNHYQLETLADIGPEEDFRLEGPFYASCTLRRQGNSRVLMRGEMQAPLSLTCDRCLAEYGFEVQSAFRLLFIAGPDCQDEKELASAAVEAVILDKAVIDVDDVLRQQIYLALPAKRLCSDQCKGLCLHCGENLNLNFCRCEAEGKPSPFAALENLKSRVR